MHHFFGQQTCSGFPGLSQATKVLACLPRANKTESIHVCNHLHMFLIYIYIIKITMTFGGVPFQKWLHWQTISSVWQEIEVLEGVEEGYRNTKSKILQVSSCSCRRCLVYCFCFFFCVCVSFYGRSFGFFGD